MYIGRYYDSFIVNTGNNNCVCPKDSKYCRYTASTGGYQVTGYGVDCKGAIADWNKLASTKHPDYTASGGGTSAKSVQKAQNPYIVPYIPKSTPSNNNGGTSANSVRQAQGVKLNASGSAGAGVTAGASVTATVNDLKTKTNQAVSDVLPDTIEEKIKGAGLPLWAIPLGIVGAGLLLILMLKR